jgi:hypothetical protein
MSSRFCRILHENVPDLQFLRRIEGKFDRRSAHAKALENEYAGAWRAISPESGGPTLKRSLAVARR